MRRSEVLAETIVFKSIGAPRTSQSKLAETTFFDKTVDAEITTETLAD
jgi:hypothetical protein